MKASPKLPNLEFYQQLTFGPAGQDNLRPGTSQTLSPWDVEQHEFPSKKLERQPKQKVKSNKCMMPVYSTIRSPRMRQNASLFSHLDSSKMNRVSIGTQQVDASLDNKQNKVEQNEHETIHEDDKHRRKRKRILLPRLPRMQGLSVKLGLSGRKLKGDRSVEHLGHNIRTSLEKDGSCLEVRTRQVVPINLREQIRKDHRGQSSSWLTANKPDIVNQIYQKIRSTIKIPH